MTRMEYLHTPATSMTSPCRIDVVTRPATTPAPSVFQRLWKPNDAKKTLLLNTPRSEDSRWKSRLHASMAGSVRSCQSMLRPAASYVSEREFNENTREIKTNSVLSRSRDSQLSESRVHWNNDVSTHGSEYTWKIHRPQTHNNVLRRPYHKMNIDPDKENNGGPKGRSSKMFSHSLGSTTPRTEKMLAKRNQERGNSRQSNGNVDTTISRRESMEQSRGPLKSLSKGYSMLSEDGSLDKSRTSSRAHRKSVNMSPAEEGISQIELSKRQSVSRLSTNGLSSGNVTARGASPEAPGDNDELTDMANLPRNTRSHGRTMSTPKLLPSAEDQQGLKAKRGMLKRQKTFMFGANTSPTEVQNRTRTIPEKEQRFHIEGEALDLFKKTARKVYIVMSWMQLLSKKDKDIDRTLKSFLDIATDLEDSTASQHIEEASGLSFDLNFYRAKKDIRLTDELKTILTLPADVRSPDMVQKVLHALQPVQAFAEYPPHMQMKFARVAWYHPVQGKRLILKQGHIAENFYFILTGTAIVKKLIEDNTGDVSMQAVARMQKGQSFGELALLHNLLRTATVESMTNMELLMIGAQDFHEIFFNAKDGEEPEHIKFCRKVDFLQVFPMEKCVETPGTCVYHYFRPGTVVVQDSNENDWIYIVKSGSCQVIKRLQGVNAQKPKLNKKSKETEIHLPRIECKIETRFRKSDRYRIKSADDADEKTPASGRLKKYLSVNSLSPANVPISLPPAIAERTVKLQSLTGSPDVLINIPRHRLNVKVIKTPPESVLSDQQDLQDEERLFDDEQQTFEESSRKWSGSEASDNTEPEETKHSRESPPVAPNSEQVERKRRKTVSKSAPVPMKNVRLKAPFRDRKRGSGSVYKSDQTGESTPRTGADEQHVCDEKEPSESGETISSIHSEVKTKKIVTFAEDKKTAEDPPASTTLVLDTRLKPKDLPPCFVMLKKLRPKEAFGLEDVVFDDDKNFDATRTPVTLISNGAELVMLSRRFFAKHANEMVRQFVRKKTRPYPSEESLQENLQTEVNWDLFRKEVVTDLLSARTDVKDILPVIM